MFTCQSVRCQNNTIPGSLDSLGVWEIPNSQRLEATAGPQLCHWSSVFMATSLLRKWVWDEQLWGLLRLAATLGEQIHGGQS